MSIKYRLLLRLFLISLILVSSGMWFGYRDTQYETRELFDAQLARSARLILSMVQADNGHTNFSRIQKYLDENEFSIPENENDDEDNEVSDTGHAYETKLAFQVWDSLGNLVLKSQNAPLTPMSEIKAGYSNHDFHDREWRVFSLTSANSRFQCITAERVDVRNDLVEKLSANLFLLFVVLIPLLSVIMWFGITRGVAPLQMLASQITRRDASNLESVSEENVPTEIKTIAGALNNLLARLKLALDREKRITSDAAHELRTPLAAVRLHAELAQKAKNDTDKNVALNYVLEGIDRTTHLVEQLLTLAKLEPVYFLKNLKPVNLKQTVIEEAALLSPIASQKNIDLSVNECNDIFIQADISSLQLLIRNLINNAINYTQDNGKVSITINTDDKATHLIIEDNGPGIPFEQRQRVLERFYRIQNHDVPGCGIGLSIVMRVVELHNAKLEMSQPETGTGLIVTVTFPNN